MAQATAVAVLLGLCCSMILCNSCKALFGLGKPGSEKRLAAGAEGAAFAVVLGSALDAAAGL